MPTFEDLHGKTIGESFAEFDAAFPDVYQQIRRQATVAISRGRSRIYQGHRQLDSLERVYRDGRREQPVSD
jgi:hypothetical protein